MKILTKNGYRNKTRYACDGLLKQRLDTPYVRENGKLKKNVMG